jgi:hypothetical protein
VWRNAATVLYDFYMAGFPVSFSDDKDIIWFPLQSGDETRLMVATWLSVPFTETLTEKVVDITLNGIIAKQVLATDLFNGTEQCLDFTVNSGDTVLQGIHIKDYPVIICFDLYNPMNEILGS